LWRKHGRGKRVADALFERNATIGLVPQRIDYCVDLVAQMMAILMQRAERSPSGRGIPGDEQPSGCCVSVVARGDRAACWQPVSLDKLDYNARVGQQRLYWVGAEQMSVHHTTLLDVGDHHRTKCGGR
jgi:hypothetical protein